MRYCLVQLAPGSGQILRTTAEVVDDVLEGRFCADRMAKRVGVPVGVYDMDLARLVYAPKSLADQVASARPDRLLPSIPRRSS